MGWCFVFVLLSLRHFPCRELTKPCLFTKQAVIIDTSASFLLDRQRGKSFKNVTPRSLFVRKNPRSLFVLPKHKKKECWRVHTWVGHEFERSTKFSVAGRSTGSYVENVRGERTQAFNVSAAGSRLHDAIAALVLILIAQTQKGNRHSKKTTKTMQKTSNTIFEMLTYINVIKKNIFSVPYLHRKVNTYQHAYYSSSYYSTLLRTHPESVSILY